ncbi:MAG: catechol 2,3-dioxygenase-like lactoylglutathione lyase family enzyme [Alphaproteobacteria bacterium]
MSAQQQSNRLLPEDSDAVKYEAKLSLGAITMTTLSPIWPAQLDHLRLDSDDPSALANFYATTFGFQTTDLSDRLSLLQGPGRRLVIGGGDPGARPYHGFRVSNRAQLDDIRVFLQGKGINLEPSPSPLFEDGAVAVRDPDGWLSVFGLPRAGLPSHPVVNTPSALTLSGRLQHVVVATNNLARMMAFYDDMLGFTPSDYCSADPDDSATRKVAFYRSDPEHHSFAVFGASEIRCDHHAYEVDSWNDIRDWADHMSALRIKLWWGPGRHGPGNNLFFMIKDPHGHQVEISAELEIMPRDMSPRVWPLEERSLNLWGPGWIRD